MLYTRGNFCVRFLCPLVAIVALGSTAQANVVTFKNGTSFSVGINNVVNYAGTQDTVRNWTAPNNNYGGWIDWTLGVNSAGHVDDGIIRFDVTAMSGQYSQINSVTLRMFKYLNGESGVFNNVSDRWVDVFTIPAVDNWVEGTAAGVGGAVQPGTATQSQPQLGVSGPWNNGFALASNHVVVPAGGAFYANFPLDPNLVNLNALVTNWSSQPINSGMLVAFDGSPGSWTRGFIFGAHENPTGIEFIPELVIDYTPVPEPASIGSIVLLGAILLTRRLGRGYMRR
jgi:hypothetical protein